MFMRKLPYGALCYLESLSPSPFICLQGAADLRLHIVDFVGQTVQDEMTRDRPVHEVTDIPMQVLG